MLILENILLALSGLLANKMRALLTMLGIIIGIASVIAILTVGDSINSSITTSMADMGANNLTVSLSQKSTEEEVTGTGMRFGAGFQKSISEEDYITDQMIEKLQVAYKDSIDCISYSESVGSGTVEDGDLSSDVTIIGANSGYLKVNELTILSGRRLSDRDLEEGKKVVLVSDYLVDTMFEGDYQKALESTISVNISDRYYNYTIVGIYEYDDSSTSTESEEDVTTEMYMPYVTAKNQTYTIEGNETLTIVSITGTDTATFMDQVETFMNQFYSENENYEISVTSMESMLSSMTEMLSTISIAISIIAGISLLVGGIGVMNIMLVSITERTREIGTRKALGATNGSIRLQFIMESIVICLLGGFIGIVLGMILGAVAVHIMGYAASPSIGGIIFSVLFSAFIGIFFGYYPANKAAKLNPIEALRYE